MSNAYGSTIDSDTARLTPYSPFTDDVLTSGTSAVRAVHIVELRTRIDAQRARYGLAAYGWTDSTLTAGSSTVRAVHIAELRAALNEVYGAAGRTPPTYTDPDLGPGTTMKAAHIAEMRAALIAIE